MSMSPAVQIDEKAFPVKPFYFRKTLYDIQNAEVREAAAFVVDAVTPGQEYSYM